MPVRTDVTIENVDRHVRGIGAIERLAAEETKRAVTGLLRALSRQLAIYPAKRPRQRYVRTGELGQGWKEADPRFVIRQGGIDARITNPSDHAIWTQGERQSWFHKGRWTPAREVLREFADDIRRGIDDAVGRAAQRAERGG